MPLEINIENVVDQTISEICALFFSAVVSGAACDPNDGTQCITLTCKLLICKYNHVYSVAALLVEAG